MNEGLEGAVMLSSTHCLQKLLQFSEPFYEVGILISVSQMR